MKLMNRLLIVLTMFVGVSPAFADTLELPSKISAVTVYPGSAHLTRTMTMDLPAGDHTIIFEKITPPLDENTLSVAGEGTAAVKIYGGYIKQEYLEQSPDERVKELQKKIQDIDDELVNQNSSLQVLDQKREYLNSIKIFAGGQLPKDMVTAMPTVDNLKGIGNYLVDELAAIEKQKNDIRIKTRDLNNERNTLNQQLSNSAWSRNNVQRHLAVDLSCSKPGKFTLNVSYLVQGASWRPVYDARTALAQGQIELTSFGVVQQRTGEDWDSVALTLSTAQPNLGGRMPYVAPWVLQPYQPMPMARRKAGMVTGFMKSVADDIGEQYASMSAATGMDANLQVAAKEERADMAFSDVAQKGLSVTYKIARPVSLKSDGTENKFPIVTQNLKADFQYSAYPKASALSYLNSDVYNSPDLQLLGGQVNLFLEGDFVGKSNIDGVAPSEKFSLYLGINENVKVKREQISKKVDDILIAGIPSPNRTTTIKIKMTVENYEAQKIRYNLFESMPTVENDKQIKVKIVDVSMEPAKKDWEDRKGVWQWIFELNPKEKKEVTYTFVVEHPREMQVSGL